MGIGVEKVKEGASEQLSNDEDLFYGEQLACLQVHGIDCARPDKLA